MSDNRRISDPSKALARLKGIEIQLDTILNASTPTPTATGPLTVPLAVSDSSEREATYGPTDEPPSPQSPQSEQSDDPEGLETEGSGPIYTFPVAKPKGFNVNKDRFHAPRQNNTSLLLKSRRISAGALQFPSQLPNVSPGNTSNSSGVSGPTSCTFHPPRRNLPKASSQDARRRHRASSPGARRTALGKPLEGNDFSDLPADAVTSPPTDRDGRGLNRLVSQGRKLFQRSNTYSSFRVSEDDSQSTWTPRVGKAFGEVCTDRNRDRSLSPTRSQPMVDSPGAALYVDTPRPASPSPAAYPRISGAGQHFLTGINGHRNSPTRHMRLVLPDSQVEIQRALLRGGKLSGNSFKRSQISQMHHCPEIDLQKQRTSTGLSSEISVRGGGAARAVLENRMPHPPQHDRFSAGAPAPRRRGPLTAQPDGQHAQSAPLTSMFPLQFRTMEIPAHLTVLPVLPAAVPSLDSAGSLLHATSISDPGAAGALAQEEGRTSRSSHLKAPSSAIRSLVFDHGNAAGAGSKGSGGAAAVAYVTPASPVAEYAGLPSFAPHYAATWTDSCSSVSTGPTFLHGPTLSTGDSLAESQLGGLSRETLFGVGAAQVPLRTRIFGRLKKLVPGMFLAKAAQVSPAIHGHAVGGGAHGGGVTARE